MNWPWWLILVILGVEGWPVTLAMALLLLTLAALARGWVRWAVTAAAPPCLAVVAVAAWWGIDARQRDRDTAAYEARVNQVLDRDEVVDGLGMPAGTVLQWQDGDHLRLGSASPPEPVALFGVRVSGLQRANDGMGWNLYLPEPETLDGWTCKEIGVGVSFAGRLRSCRLAAGREWNGWPIPGGSFLDLTRGDEVGLTLPDGSGLAAPEIGQRIMNTGVITLNADGSLDQVYFENDAPLLVAGQRLWNSVRWTYDHATFGQGRRRQAVTVRGTLVSVDGDTGGKVVIRLADGRVTAAE